MIEIDYVDGLSKVIQIAAGIAVGELIWWAIDTFILTKKGKK